MTSTTTTPTITTTTVAAITRRTIVGRFIVTPVCGGYRLSLPGDPRVYALASEAATALSLGRQTGAGRKVPFLN
jgi:hypothetical protein